MVTCKLDTVAVPKMSSFRRHKHLPQTSPTTNSNSSVQRLMTDGNGDQIESSSSVSHNSIYKLKIDLMFDDTRLIRSNRLDDPRGSHRTRSIIMYGRSELASTAGASSRSITSILKDSNNADPGKLLTETTKKDVRRVSNSVQAQIEQLFTDVAKDATSSFAVTCLGALPLKDKVTSLQGLQVPLRELYMRELITERRRSGSLDICATGLRVKVNGSAMVTISSNKNNNNNSNNNNNNSNNTNNTYNETSIIPAKCGNDDNNSSDAVSDNYNDNCNYGDGNITPFHNIAVWSAVKFVISEDDGGAAFLPLITDPENIDKSMLFQPLNSLEEKRVASNTHAPIFAVVMRSSGVPKVLECHGFICRSTEDAIVIAATLYQSLMAHVNANSQCSTKRRAPRNQNGVSCISIASSTAQTGSNYLTRSQLVSPERKSSSRNSNASIRSPNVCSNSNVGNRNALSSSMVMRSVRKKRISTSSLSCSSQVINEASETTTEERKRRSHKTKRAPPIPGSTHTHTHGGDGVSSSSPPALKPGVTNTPASCRQQSFSKAPSLSALCVSNSSFRSNNSAQLQRVYTPVSHNHSKAKSKHSTDTISRASEMIGAKTEPTVNYASNDNGVGVMMRSETNGDILTRVAIPRSGSFLNTGGLTRYKSRGIRRQSNKPDACEGDCGSSGGTPLGFSELFNEFRLHENLHSLDEILYAIIDADGMSFNDLKPIYKEFLLKLAVTLTKDELYQRSKNIMRRQKKKKLNHQIGNAGSQRRPRILLFGTKSLKKVFHLDQFRSCRGKSSKPVRHKNHFAEAKAERRKSGAQLVIGPPMVITQRQHQQQQLPPQQQQRNRVANSGSEVSVSRQENAFNGLNRNSSSGYVSCSEYSYDSEACTCAPAERCYCSLRNERLSHRQRRKNTLSVTSNSTGMQKPARESRQKQNGTNIRHQPLKELSSSTPDSRRSGGNNRSSASSSCNTHPTNNNNSHVNRRSLISCKSDEKCYCSMVEEDSVQDDVESINEPEVEDDAEESTNTHSDTTWCDTDSCVSTSKCYCQRERRSSRNRSTPLPAHDHHDHHEQIPRSSSRQRQSSEPPSRSQHSNKTINEKLALDYELFTIGGNRKSMPPYEALSMKKSVEAAAVFADVKLRQTTDIKSVSSSTTTPTNSSTPPTPPRDTPSRRSNVSNTSRASSRKQQYEIHCSNNSNNSNNNDGHNKQRCQSKCSDRRDDHYKSQIITSPPAMSAMKSHSADDLFKKLDSVDALVASVGASVRSCSVSKQSDRDFHHFSVREKNFANINNSYQPIKAVSASLEDTLGYLP